MSWIFYPDRYHSRLLIRAEDLVHDGIGTGEVRSRKLEVMALVVSSPRGARAEVSAAMTIGVQSEEAKHAERECRDDEDQRRGAGPDDRVRPPWEEETSRVFRASVMSGVKRLPALENGILTERSMEYESVEAIKKEGANGVPSHECDE